MEKARSVRIGTVVFAVAALLVPSAARAQEEAAIPAAGAEEQPAEVAAPADEAAPAPADSQAPAPAKSTEAAPAPAKAERAPVAPAVPIRDQDVKAAQDIAALSQLSLEDLLAVPAWRVTTASKREESSASAPATVFVITKDDIYLRGYSNLVDVLKDLPGMEITEYVYAPIGTQVAVRGVVGNNKIIVLVNGMRVNPPGGDPLGLRSDFSVREAEQIEVIYGPGSTLYGQDAISAVINVKTKKVGGEHWLDVGAGAGYPWRYESWLGLNRKIGEAEINGYVQYSDATLTNREDEFPDEYATYRTNYAMVPQGPAVLDNPKRWDRGLNAFLQLAQGNFSTQLWHRQSWRSSAEGRAGTSPFIEDSKWSDVATVADARHVFKLADNVSLSSTATFNRFQLLPESRFIVPVGAGWVVDRKYAMETSFTLEETLSAKIGERISLLGGLVYGHYDVMPMGTVPKGLDTSSDISSQAGTINYYTTPGDPSSIQSINKVNNPVYQNVGIYAEGTVKLHNRVRVLLGMRVDKDERYDEVPLSPRAAVIVKPIDELSLKAIYTQAYVAPAPYNMFDVYQSWWISTTNLDLKPERARSFELNAEFRRGNLLASVSGY
jgi:outer membrane receptor protein involved in Fe transport